MPSRSVFALLLALTFLLAPRAEAQEQAPPQSAAPDYRGIVLAQLDGATRAVQQHGFAPDQTAVSREQVIGMLAGDSSAMFEVNLTEGANYLITGVCDEDCGDLDLGLYLDGSLVVQDIEDDDVPVLEFTAARNGSYMLDVRMVECETNLCYFGFRVLRK